MPEALWIGRSSATTDLDGHALWELRAVRASAGGAGVPTMGLDGAAPRGPVADNSLWESGTHGLVDGPGAYLGGAPLWEPRPDWQAPSLVGAFPWEPGNKTPTSTMQLGDAPLWEPLNDGRPGVGVNDLDERASVGARRRRGDRGAGAVPRRGHPSLRRRKSARRLACPRRVGVGRLVAGVGGTPGRAHLPGGPSSGRGPALDGRVAGGTQRGVLHRQEQGPERGSRHRRHRGAGSDYPRPGSAGISRRGAHRRPSPPRAAAQGERLHLGGGRPRAPASPVRPRGLAGAARGVPP